MGLIYVILAFLGLSLGSFVNALVWRLHEQQKTRVKNQKPLSILYGRSMCVHCGHELAAKDLIPVLSWVWLKGKCRYCKKPISWQYPIVELTTAVLFVLSYIYWPAFQGRALETAGAVDFGVWLVSLVGLMALIVYDLRWMILPNKIIFPLMALASLNVLAQCLLSSNFQPLLSGLWGALIGGGLFYLLFQISGGRWIGGGDVKLGFLLGILVGGPPLALLMLFTASLLGSAYSLPLMAKGSLTAKAKIPFGPFLIMAAVISELFGQKLIDWYGHMFLI